MTTKTSGTCIVGILMFFLLAFVPCLAQQSFLGLKAGISTKPEIERVLGRPVKQVSPTLIEYTPKQLKLKADNKSMNSGKIFVQYRDDSAAPVAERIEMIICEQIALSKADAACDMSALSREFDPGGEDSGGTLDAVITTYGKNGFRMIRYFGAPRYTVRTDVHRTGAEGATVEGRWAFYSPDLYASVAPKGNCLGTIWGEWETEWGRLTLKRTDIGKFHATYDKHNGTVAGVKDGERSLEGEWKDSSGSGTISLRFLPLSRGPSLQGRWSRKTGNGPMEGTWEGRCVEASR